MRKRFSVPIRRDWLFLMLLFCSWVPARSQAPVGTSPPLPLPVEQTNTAVARWLQKPVLNSRLLDDLEQTNHWSHHGHGAITFIRERAKDGQQSLRLQAPTQAQTPNGEPGGRPFGEAVAQRNFDHESWTNFNRLSFWVYPHLPGFHVISMLVKLHNDGQSKLPDRYGREGLNYFLLEPDRWNHVVWEIPHLARDQVTGLDFVYRLQGNEPEATNIVSFDLDQLELQQVQPDTYEGWQVPAGQLAYSHSGYQAGSRKVAVASALPAKQFQLLLLPPQPAPAKPAPSLKEAKTLLNKDVQQVQTRLGKFQLLDFSEIRQPGQYVLRAGETVSRPFTIQDQVWRPSLWKTLNLFYCERCGTEIPGVHRACHRDWRAQHGSQTLVINGGWHDAGDLSQGLVNTAEAVQAMIQLAQRLRPDQPALADRLLDEAKWGLAWLHKTRFDDGHRVTWATMDYWTDGKVGTADDTFGQVGDDPFAIYHAAAAEALAAQTFKNTEPELSAKSLSLARADWAFADEQCRDPGLELASAGALAAMQLFKATGEQAYANRAQELANAITHSQQRTWTDWPVPLLGFFHTTTNRDRILHYFHRGHEQGPIVALADLCQSFPQHQLWMEWYATILLHSEYLRAISQYTAPYHMPPASAYRTDESDEPGFREQVQQGVPLGSNHYLRLFPVWFAFRGNHGTILSQIKALSTAAQLRQDPSLWRLADEQLQWVVGRNPFAQSTLFGEGHNYAPQYTAMSGDMVGSLPVGFQTRTHLDLPYWPAANCYNYKEVWVHPSTRWLSAMADLSGSAYVVARDLPQDQDGLRFTELTTGQRYLLKPDKARNAFRLPLPIGQYKLQQGQAEHIVQLLPGTIYNGNPPALQEFTVSVRTNLANKVRIKVRLDGTGKHRLQLRTYNLQVQKPELTVDLNPFKAETVNWEADVISSKEAWIAVVVPDNNLANRKELFALNPPLKP